MEYFSLHHDYFFYAIACACLLLELGVLGMSGPLLFIALGCFISGVLVSLHIISGWEIEIFMAGLLAAISAVLLWAPLKRFQNAGGGPDTSSDMIGKKLPVIFTISQNEGRIFYSGIEWQARLANATDDVIEPPQFVTVVGVSGALLLVSAH